MLFSGSVAESCTKAGIQATSIYALSGSGALKTSMQQRAGLCFNLGHFYKWMIESQISEIVLDEVRQIIPFQILSIVILTTD